MCFLGIYRDSVEDFIICISLSRSKYCFSHSTGDSPLLKLGGHATTLGGRDYPSGLITPANECSTLGYLRRKAKGRLTGA